MRIGRRDQAGDASPETSGQPGPPDEGEGIAEFWSWWRAGAAERLARVFEGRETLDVAAEVGPRVQAVGPGLAWEFGPGLHSRHRLTVTAGGDPELRATARRWRHAAPPADDVWSFHDSRQPSGSTSGLSIAGAEVAAADVTVRAEAAGTGLDVTLHHPSFETLDDKTRMQVAYLLLDGVLGEELVELWLGRIETSTSRLDGAQGLDTLPQLLAPVVEAGTVDGAGGELSWVLLRGDGPDGPVVALTRSRLSAVQAPELDAYVGVVVDYADRTEEGWPGPGSLDALRALEDHLTTIVGSSGSLVAHESSAGRRTLHFFVDGTTPAAAQLEAASRGWDQGPVSVHVEPDPAWAAVRHLRG